MSSANSYHQLAMYMTPRELRHAELGDTYVTGEEDHEILRRKLRESNKSGLATRIRKEGVKKPIHLFHENDGTSTITDGHHRLAVAQTMRPDTLIPVEHHDENSGW